MHPSAAYHSLCSMLLSPRSSSTKFYPLLMFVLAWLLTLLLISSCVGLDANITSDHSLDEQSFYDLQCKGVYDKTIFANVDDICKKCDGLFFQTNVYKLCRKNCFTTDSFQGCVDILHQRSQSEKFQRWVKQLNGSDPRVLSQSLSNLLYPLNWLPSPCKNEISNTIQL